MNLKNYWLPLIWILVFGAISRLINMKREEVIDGQRSIRWNKWFALLMVIPLIIWAGWRKNFGDTEVYRGLFEKLPSSAGQISEYMKGVQKGYGFELLQCLFKCFISTSPIVFFLFIAAVQTLCMVYVYRRYSTDYWLSFFLFIASTDYLSWMHNGMRQFLAVSLVFLCVPLIAKKKIIPSVIIILFASLIHSVALICLPFVFVVNGRAWNYRTLLFIVAMIVAIVFVDRVVKFIENAMEDTVYEGDIEILRTDDGTNIIRVLFYSVPAIMSWAYRPYLDRENNPLINVCANLSIITAGFYVFSFFTSGILMGAIPIFFSLSNYILIPWFIKEVFEKKSAVVIEMIFILVYSFFFYYQCGPTWGVL